MITRDVREFYTQLKSGSVTADAPAVPRGVFMVEPIDFRVSPETAEDNRYMEPGRAVDADRALQQYIGLVSLIRESGVSVKTFPGNPGTPDDIFPNNVFATVPGRFIVGRMRHANRRLEAERADIRQYFEAQGYRTVDLSGQDFIAELTGNLVIDRARRIGFCGMTTRVDEAGLRAMHDAFELRLTLQFDLAPTEYHTNLVLAVLAGKACVLHDGSFPDPAVPRIIDRVYGGRVLYLSDEEKSAFAGNCIALTPREVFMSRRAVGALRPSSRALIDSWGFRIRATELDEIEKAGGSLRCMVAEIY